MKAVFDYVIVGSGAGGSVLAEKLSRDGASSVLLLEAGGPDRNPVHLVPKGVRFVMSNPKYTKSYDVEPYGDQKLDNWRRGRILGGSTTLNGMVWNRGWAPEYDAWEKAGNAGWNWDRFLTAYREMEDHELGGSDLRGEGGPVRITRARPPEPVCDAFVKALSRHGIPQVDDINSSGNERVAYVSSNIKNGTRVSAARAYVWGSWRRPNLTLVKHADVERITFNGTKATGVVAARGDRKVQFTARREVLVCGGGLESPLLLERSGIGDAAVLDAAGVAVLVDSPKVGENLREHRTVLFQPKLRGRQGFNHQVNSGPKQAWAGFKYLFTRSGVISFAGFNVIAIYKSDPTSEHPDTQGFFTPLTVSGVDSGRPVVDKTSGAMFLNYQLFPTSAGSVHITGPDATHKPRIVANFLDTDHDRALTVKMVNKAREILATEPLAGLVESEVVPGDAIRSDDDVVDYVINQGGLGYHTLGSCAVGPDQDDVLDERLRVRGTSNLRVVDASVFPEMPSGNNNAPTQAMAWIAADMIINDNS